MKRILKPRPRKDQGFTLAEVSIAGVVGSIVLSALANGLAAQQISMGKMALRQEAMGVIDVAAKQAESEVFNDKIGLCDLVWGARNEETLGASRVTATCRKTPTGKITGTATRLVPCPVCPLLVNPPTEEPV